jgi:adenylosuccinate synthase
MLSRNSLDALLKVEVQYVTLPGWQASITTMASFDLLPHNCKKYIESFLGIPIEWIGVGPGRESMLRKEELQRD